MNKYLLSSVAAVLLLLPSCLDGGDDSTASYTYNSNVFITANDGSFTGIASAKFGLNFNLTNKTVDVTLSDVSIDGGTLSFNSGNLLYSQVTNNFGATTSFSSSSFASSGLVSTINNFSGKLTTAINSPASLKITEAQGGQTAAYNVEDIIVSANLADKYKMVTIPSVAYYKGVSVVTKKIQSEEEPAEPGNATLVTDDNSSDNPAATETVDVMTDNGIYYRLFINPASKVGSAVVYNLRLNSDDKARTIFIDKLDLTASNGVITLSSVDIEYSVFNGDKYIHKDSDILSSFSASVAIDTPTEASISLVTPENEIVSFSGSYLNK